MYGYQFICKGFVRSGTWGLGWVFVEICKVNVGAAVVYHGKLGFAVTVCMQLRAWLRVLGLGCTKGSGKRYGLWYG